MHHEHFSVLNANYYFGCHPFDLRSYFESDPFYEDLDSKIPTIFVKPIIDTPEPNNRRRVLDKILKEVSEQNPPGKVHFQQYMRHKYRCNCKPRTLLSAFTGLKQFLSFYKKTGKDRLEQLTRQDIEAFVEHEQDRGLKISFSN